MAEKDKRFKLILSEVDEKEVDVLSFEGDEEISALFKYRIELLSSNRSLDPKKILNKKATLQIIREKGQEPHEIHGIISHFEQRGFEPYVSYYVELVPRLWHLGLTRQSAVYQNSTLKELISLMLKQRDASGTGYGLDIPWRFELSNNPSLEYVVQHQESNLQFINRRLEHFGVCYYFEHKAGEDTIVFSDRNNFTKITADGPVPYRPPRGAGADQSTLIEWNYREQVVTGLFRLKDYDYEKPTSPLEVESQLDGEAPGLQYEYGNHYTEQGEGKTLVRIRNEEQLCQCRVITGVSDMQTFRAGFTFTMAKHYRDEWNQNYLITGLRVRGIQRGLFGHLEDTGEDIPPYRNEFRVIPADVVYRPPRRTPIPRLPGIMSSVVESSQEDDPYAFIDNDGRYKVRMKFDMRPKDQVGDATVAVRQIQPYSGNDYGIHFPNHAGTEMVWACVNGDVDRPMAIGTVAHKDTPSPVNAELKTKSTIRTEGLNELTLDDKKGEENIYLHGTKDYTIEIKNDKNQEVERDKTLKVGRDQTNKIERNLKEDIKGWHVENTDGNIVMKSKEKIILQCGASRIVMSPVGITIKAPLVKINC